MRLTFEEHGADTLKLQGRRWLGWRTLAWTSLAALLLYTLGLGNHTLWDYHEPYVGGIIREMATSGDFVVPTLNGQPYLEKPPFFYALGALLCRAFHTFEPWALRLPSALLASTTVSFVGFLGWRLSSARAGAWAGFMLATSVLFFTEGHSAVVDMTLTAAVTFALGLAFLVVLEPPYRSRWAPLFWLALASAFLAKGVVGPLMVALPLACLVLLERDRGLLRAFLAPNWGMAVGLVLVFGWVGALWARGGGEFLREVFLRNTLGRFVQDPALIPRTGRLGDHVEPVTFYLTRTPGNVLPWFFLWIGALWSALPRHRRHPLSPRTYFLPLAFGLNLLFLTLSRTKRMVYLLPVLPVTFLHTALWLDLRIPRLRRRMDSQLTVLMVLTLTLVGLLGAGFPWVLAAQGLFPAPAAAALSLGSLLLSALALRDQWRRDHPRALDVAMLQFLAFLALFLAFAVPALDRERWRPLVAPYQAALDLERRGYRLFGAGLTETQLGHASLAFRHGLPLLEGEALDRTLRGPGPLAVLVEPALFQAQILGRGLPGGEVDTPARHHREASRAPVLWVRP